MEGIHAEAKFSAERIVERHLNSKIWKEITAKEKY